MSLDEYISWFHSCFEEKHLKHRGKMRLGQWMMHRLDVRDRYVHKKVSASENNPFSDDSKIPAMLAEILTQHVFLDSPQKKQV